MGAPRAGEAVAASEEGEAAGRLVVVSPMGGGVGDVEFSIVGDGVTWASVKAERLCSG